MNVFWCIEIDQTKNKIVELPVPSCLVPYLSLTHPLPVPYPSLTRPFPDTYLSLTRLASIGLSRSHKRDGDRHYI